MEAEEGFGAGRTIKIKLSCFSVAECGGRGEEGSMFCGGRFSSWAGARRSSPRRKARSDFVGNGPGVNISERGVFARVCFSVPECVNPPAPPVRSKACKFRVVRLGCEGDAGLGIADGGSAFTTGSVRRGEDAGVSTTDGASPPGWDGDLDRFSGSGFFTEGNEGNEGSEEREEGEVVLTAVFAGSRIAAEAGQGFWGAGEEAGVVQCGTACDSVSVNCGLMEGDGDSDSLTADGADFSDGEI